MSIWSWSDFVAGWAGGVAGLIVGHPADTIKVRQQAFIQGDGPLRSFKRTLQYEGVRGLYKGLSFPLISAGVLNAIFFGAYGNVLRASEHLQHGHTLQVGKSCPPPELRPPILDVFLAGCAGGLVATLVACPVEVIKIQMQSQTGAGSAAWGSHHEPRHNGVIDCCLSIYKQRGFRGFYRAFGSMLVRDPVSFGVYMTLYESILRRWSQPRNDVSLIMLAGGISGVMSWALITPIDVVKSRLQADNPANPQYRSAWHCTQASYRQGGLPVFFRGFWMMVGRSFPVNAATFVVYEWFMKHLVKDDSSERGDNR